MTADLKPYPHYKPSGVEWIGDIPAHWEVRRVKHAFRRIVGGSTPSSSEAAYWDGTIIWVTPTDISKVTRLRDSQRRITKKGFDSCSTTLVPAGSLVVTSRAPVGNVALAEVPLCTNQGCKTLVPDSQVIDSAYGYQVFGILQGELQSLANGTTFTEISTNALGNVLLPIPPLAEQAAIVRYLDHTDGRIRRYLRSRERLIELLKEYRQATIHETVTRGLDPDVPLKPSGVEWLGDIPAHWDVTAVKRHYSIQLGKMLQNFPHSPKDVEVPYLKAQHVQWFSVRTTDVPTMWASPYDMEQFGIRAGDLLVCEGGEGGRCSLVKEVPPGCIIQNALHRVRALETGRNDYLQYVMSSISRAGWFDAINNKATIAHFTVEKFRSLRIPIPPLAEQAAIAAYLDKQTAAIDAAMARAQREFELLSEYRTRLIVDVVTGQVDVREEGT